MEKMGILYGIGVGPGDPELITVKAARVLKEVDVVFTAASTKNDYSTAYEIARRYIPEDTDVVALPFKMTIKHTARRQAREENAKKVLPYLREGKNAAFLTLGDPLTYSTFSYLAQALQELEPGVDIRVIPGITSYQAAASRLLVPLCEGEESLLVLSGALGGQALRKLAGSVDNIVMLKTYKNFGDITQTLEDLELTEKTVGISRCGLDGEEIIDDIRQFKDSHPPYFTLLIVKPGGKDKNIF